MRVLIVDDHAVLRDGLKNILDEPRGTAVCHEASTAQDACALVERQDWDLVVLDIMLPDINGKEVCQRVRSDHSLEAVKIICISGMVEHDKINDLRSAGADDFLQKPFTTDKLLDRSCDLLEIERPVAS